MRRSRRIDRIRTLSARLAVRLPAEGLPRPTRLLSQACEAVKREAAFVADVAAMLTTYAVLLSDELRGA